MPIVKSFLKEVYREISQYPEMDTRSRFEFLTTLSKIAHVQPQPACGTEESVCPYTKEHLNTPCALKKCLFWVDKDWTKNCSLNFLLKQNADNLSVAQVSLLYGKSPERVDSIYKRCFKIMQRHYLKNRLRELKIPRFRYIPGYCVTCQSRIEEPELSDASLSLGDGHGYCSASCKKEHPPLHFEIEKFFESEFWKVIEVGGSLFTFAYLEEILGFQSNVLRNRLEKIRDKD